MGTLHFGRQINILERIESRVLLSAGQLDTSFGSAGVASIATLPGEWHAIATLPNGGFMVTGRSLQPHLPADTIVARYHADGSPDQSFGQGGVERLDMGGFDAGDTIMLRPDGRIVIGGKVDGVGATIRLNGDGGVDQTFAKKGVLSGFVAQFIQPDGQMVGTSGDHLVQRRSPKAGVLDPTFGNEGSIDLLSGQTGLRVVSKIHLLPRADKKLLAVYGTISGGDKFDGTVNTRQFTSTGGIDSKFTFGAVDYDPRVNGSSEGISTICVAQNQAGQIFESVSSALDNPLSEFNADGTAVASFEPDFDFEETIHALAVPSDGRIDAIFGDGTVRQFLADGTIDLHFDAGLRHNFPGYGEAAEVDSSGRLLIAGLANPGSENTSVFVPALFSITTHDDGSPIQSFNGGHIVDFFGTSKADHFSVKRTSTGVKFSADGYSKTIAGGKLTSINVYAGAGDDVISIDGKNTDIYVDCGNGNDTVKILSGDQATVDGDDGNDSIDGSGINPKKNTGGLSAYGGAGNDYIIGSTLGDYIEGNSGNDTLNGNGDGGDGLYGGTGDDLLINRVGVREGGAGDDTLTGGLGAVGGGGNDTILPR